MLADEINRAPAKVQSALLEAMQERQVTIGEQTFALPDPFLVLATQNPLDQEGTYQLPEAQLDRFMFNVVIDYPSKAEEHGILSLTTGDAEPVITPVADAANIEAMRHLVRDVPAASNIIDYALRIVRASRNQLEASSGATVTSWPSTNIPERKSFFWKAASASRFNAADGLVTVPASLLI